MGDVKKYFISKGVIIGFVQTVAAAKNDFPNLIFTGVPYPVAVSAIDSL